MQTANKVYKYNTKMFGKTLYGHAKLANVFLEKHFCWGPHTPLKIGGFGTENMICRMGAAMRKLKSRLRAGLVPSKVWEIEAQIAKDIHDGWCENYTYWRDNKPWLSDHFYSKPAKMFHNIDHRNVRAETEWEDLPFPDKESTIVLARYVISCINL
jgi:hypothetical protein